MMAKKRFISIVAFCLSVSVCMCMFCMQVLAVQENQEIIIEEEVLIDENGLPLVDIPDEPIPITELPEGMDVPEEPAEVIIELADEDIPLAAVPQTGDPSVLWLALSGVGLSGTLLIGGGRTKNE